MHKLNTKINLNKNHKQFFEFLKGYLLSEFGLSLPMNKFLKIYAIVLYQTFKTKYKSHISSSLSKKEKSLVNKEVKAFNKINTARGTLSGDRLDCISHPAIAFAKCLYLKNKDCQDIFLAKLINRKGIYVGDIQRFLETINENLGKYVLEGSLSNN